MPGKEITESASDADIASLRSSFKLAQEWSGLSVDDFKIACRAQLLMGPFEAPAPADWCDAAQSVCDAIHTALWGNEPQEVRMAIESASGSYGKGWPRASRDARYGAIAWHVLSMLGRFHPESSVDEVAGVMASVAVSDAVRRFM